MPRTSDVAGATNKNGAATTASLAKTQDVNGGEPTELRELLHALQAMRVGDFSVRMPGHQTGLMGKVADTFNEIVTANQRMAKQLERVGQVVGREGKTRQRVRFGLSEGAWGEMESSVNSLIDDLLWPTTEVTRAIAAVAQGDLLQTVSLDVDGRPLKGEFLRSAEIVNTMIKQLNVFTSEVTRVAREVGTEGKLGGQAQVGGVTGVWKDLTESVNSMASNLTAQVRNIAEVTIAVANGDLSKKITVDVRGEILQLKEAINTMVDQLRSFASEVTRVAREVGTDGKLGGQAIVPGVAGTWKDLTDSVNAMCGNLTDQVRNIAHVTTAVARGDLSRKITVDVRGEILELKDTINTMVDQLNGFASEVTRVAREVGTEGKLGGQAQVPGVAGTWKDLTDSVNFMAGNLTAQVRNIADVATAIAGGDLSKKITVNVSGEILQLKETINTMVDQLNAFAGEVTRVAREVGTEGRLGGQANVLGVAGTWKDLTDSVNSMASNLTAQVRNIAEVSTAIASGDLSKKITVDVRGEILELKDTINTMVDQLNAFAGEVTRVAREVGTEGKLGGQAMVRGVAGTWKDLTDSVNSMASNLTGQVRNIAEVATAVARGDLSRKITVDVRGEILELKDTLNTMVDQLNAFAAEVTRVAREVGTEGKLGGQAQVPGVAGTWKDLTELGQLHGRQSHRPGPQHRRGGDRHRRRRPLAQDHGRRARRNPSAEGNAQHHGRSAQPLRRRSDARRPRSRHRRPARRPGQRARRRRHLEGPDRLREFHGRQSDRPGAQHRRSDDRGRPRRPLAQDHRRREGRNSRAEEHHQHDGRSAQRLCLRSDARRPRSRHRRQARRPGASAGRRRHLERPDRQRQLHGVEPHRAGPQHRRGGDRHRRRRPVEEDHGRRARRDAAAQRHAQHHGRAAALVRRRSDPRRARSRRRRPARRPGGGARRRRHLEGPDRQRQPFGGQPDDPGAQHRRGDHRGGARRPVAQDHRRREGRNSRTEEHHQHDGGPAQRLCLGSHPRRPRGRHRRPARRPGPSARRRRHLEGFDRHRQRHGRQPDRAGARHRQGRDRGRQRRSQAEPDGEIEGRGGGAGRDHQQHDGYACDLRRSGHHRGARSRRRGPPRRPGQRARRRRHLEGPDRQRQPARRQSHHPGARHRRGGDRGDQGRPHPLDSGGSARRSGRAERQHQHHDRQSAAHHRPQHRAGLAQDQPGEIHQHAAGPARSDDRRPAAAVGTDAARQRPSGRDLSDGQRGDAQPSPAGRLRRRRRQRPRVGAPPRRGPDRPVRGRQAPHADHRNAGERHRHRLGAVQGARRATTSCCRCCSKAR